MRLILITNPFRRNKRKYLDYSNQDTIENIIKENISFISQGNKKLKEIEQVKESFNCIIDGCVIPVDDWSVYTVLNNQELILIPIVGKSSGTKFTVAAIATFALGMIGQPLTLGYLLLAYAGLVKYTQSLKPEEPDSRNSNAYGWSPTTLQSQGIVRPKWYGTNKLYGNIIASHTTSIVEAGQERFGPYTQNIDMLIALGAGPVNGIVAGSIKLNNQTTDNFPDVVLEERKGTIDQSEVSFFTSTKIEYTPNISVTKDGGAQTFITPSRDFDDIEIEIVFPRGLYGQSSTKKVARFVEYTIEIRELGGTWYTLFDDRTAANCTQPVRVLYEVNSIAPSGFSVTRGNQYEIRVTRNTNDLPVTAAAPDALRLGTVREVINDSFAYPKMSLIGIQAAASEKISGQLGFSCIQEGSIINVYNGSTWSLEFNNNPAWVLWDILTCPVISGDGSSGSPYTIERYDGIDYGTYPERLDLAKFYELAQYCDELVPDKEGNSANEKRVTFNGGFDQNTTVWEAALQVAEIARASLVWNGGQITLAIDKADDPVQLFNVSNMLVDSFKKEYTPQSDLAREIEIQYRDEDQDYQRTSLVAFNPDLENRPKKMRMDLFGVTKSSEAWRIAAWRLQQNNYVRSTILFEADIDAIACTIGDVINVQHDIPQWGEGGRIVSGSQTYFYTEKDIQLESGSIYLVNVRKTDDALNERTILTAPQSINTIPSTTTFTLTGDQTAYYVADDRIEIVNSDNNDGIYTVDSVSYSTLTTITVNETLDTTPGNFGDVRNLRRFVVNTAFKDASDVNDAVNPNELYAIGVQNSDIKKYRIIHIVKSAEQRVKITAIEYNASLYDSETDIPIVPVDQGVTSPDSDGSTVIGSPSTTEDSRALSPLTATNDPTRDKPESFNIEWTSDDPSGGSVSWSAKDSDYPLQIIYDGESYDITAGNTTDEYIYWDSSSPTVFGTTNSLSTIATSTRWLMASNDGGTVFPYYGLKIIHGMIIEADSITSTQILVSDLFAQNIVIQDGGKLRSGKTSVSDTTNSGYCIEYDSAGDGAGFIVGNATDYVQFTESGGWINVGSAFKGDTGDTGDTGDQGPIGLRGWTHDLVFSLDGTNPDTTVNWTSGTVYFPDGTSQAIIAGSTGVMSALNYIYYDSTNTLKTTTSASTAMGSGNTNFLIGIAKNQTDECQFQIFGGDTDNLLITTDNIAANAVTANEINVNNLAAISANIGTVTSGTITGVNGTFTNLTAKQSVQIGEDTGTDTFNIIVNGSGVTQLLARRIDTGTYYETVLDSNGLSVYARSGAWPAQGATYQIAQIGGTFDWAEFDDLRPASITAASGTFTADAAGGQFGNDADTKLTYDGSGIVAVPPASFDFSTGSVSGKFFDSGWQTNGGAGYGGNLTTPFSHGLGAIPTFVHVLVRNHSTTTQITEAHLQGGSFGTAWSDISTSQIWIHTNGVPMIYYGTNWTLVDIRIFAWL